MWSATVVVVWIAIVVPIGAGSGRAGSAGLSGILSNLALPRTTEDDRRVLMSPVWLGDEHV